MAERILYVCPNGRRGGAESNLALLVKHHDRSRWEPEIHFLNDGPLVDELRSVCPVHVGGGPRLSQPRAVAAEVRELVRRIEKGKFDLVHGVMSYGHLFAGAAAGLARVPAVWFQHGPVSRLDWVAGRIPARTLFVNSDYTRSQQARYRAHARRVVRVYPGVEPVDPASLAAEAARIRGEQGFAPDDVVFAIVGRITPLKGHRFLADALALALQHADRLKLLVVGGTFMPGDEEYLADFRQRLEDRGIADRVRLTGHLAAPQAAIAACDVVVNASVAPEGFGLSLVEGMMLGKPVLAPAEGGPVEIVRDGVDGLHYRERDDRDLAEKIAQLANTPEFRAKLGAAGRARALEKFTISRMVAELEAEYAKR